MCGQHRSVSVGDYKSADCIHTGSLLLPLSLQKSSEAPQKGSRA
jgi:hypothetical protein